MESNDSKIEKRVEPQIEQDPNWQINEYIDMVALELKELIKDKPEQEQEIKDLLIELRSKIAGLEK